MIPAPAHASALVVSGPSVVSIGESFVVRVYASSTERGFNAAEATISYPKDVLQVDSIDSSSSATLLSFWLLYPEFSNQVGTVRFSGGTTHGAVGASVPLLSIRMHAIGSGDTIITASDASINAADGSGSNILESIVPARVTVRNARVAVPPKNETEASPLPAPLPPKPPRTTSIPATSTTTLSPCTSPFGYCDLSLPTIEMVRVGHYADTSTVFVSGTAREGTHVHVILNRGGVFYTEVVAVITPERTWEATLPSIYAYGVYTVDARAETMDDHASQKVSSEKINIFPPYSLVLFDIVLEWYMLLEAFFVLVFLSTCYYFVYSRLRKTQSPTIESHPMIRYTPELFLFSATTLLLTMSFIAYQLWDRQYRASTIYWPGTNVPCIQLENSLDDSYFSATLSIFIDGKPLVVPAGMGISPTCIAQIHTHDDTGHLHFAPSARAVTLSDLVKVSGIRRPSQSGYLLSVTLNDNPYAGDINTYELKNGDRIVLTYVKKSVQPR